MEKEVSNKEMETIQDDPNTTSTTSDTSDLNQPDASAKDSHENADAEQKKDSKFNFKKKKISKEKELETKCEELTLQLAQQKDQFLRLFSEFDNYRKRTSKEKLELIKNASEDVVSSMLTIMDDFQRAIKNMETATDIEALKEGEKLIYNKLNHILTQKGLKPMTSIGETFNADIHEAITQVPVTDEEQKGKVIDEVEKGYLLNEKVIRFAKVVVGQ